MNFNAQRNRFSFFGGQVTAVKQWGIGWTTEQAAQAAARMAGQSRPKTVGIYGVLAGVNRHVTGQ